MDTISQEKRSWNMARIRSKDTQPEKMVRSLLHRMGYRFRLHRQNLPGKPDIVLPQYRIALFVHGCFWHRHIGCKYAYTPKSRPEFWQKKFKANVERHKTVERLLKKAGWRVVVIWECELRKAAKLRSRIRRLLPKV